MTKPLNILFWQWLHNRLESAYNQVWRRKLALYYFAESARQTHTVTLVGPDGVQQGFESKKSPVGASSN